MSPPQSARGGVATVAVVAAVAVVAVAAAALLFAAPAAPTGDRVGANASAEYAAVDGVTATRTTVVERGDRTSETVVDVALRPGTDLRRTELVAGDRTHEVTASNGSVLWLYDADAGEVTRVPLSGPPADGSTAGDRIERLFAALNVTQPSDEAAATVDDQISALPVVPAASAGADAPTTANASARVAFEGAATVDGRDAYVLHVEPAGDAPAFEQTLWVDRETFFPLKRQTSWTDDGTPVTVTTTYANVTVNPGLDDDTFRFDAPGDATVETLETPRTTAYDSVADLRAATDAPVPSLDLPPSFRLTYATETTGRIHGTGVRYANETALVTAAAYNRTVPADGDTVSVNGHEAVVDVGPTTSVSWNCGEYRYTVRGRAVSVDFLVDVARSLDCE